MSTSATDNSVAFTAATDSRQQLKTELAQQQAQLMRLTEQSDPLQRSQIQYTISEIML